MSSQFYWTQSYGSPETVVPALSGGVPSSAEFNNLDFMNYDGFTWDGEEGYVSYTAYPVRVPAADANYSYEKWLRAYWLFSEGITNQISNVHLYRSDSSGMNDEALSVYAKIQTSFSAQSAPPSQRSAGAGTQAFFYYNSGWQGPTQAYESNGNIGASENAPNNTKVTLGGGNATLSASGFSDYIVLQLKVPSTVSEPGNIGTLAWKMQWDES